MHISSPIVLGIDPGARQIGIAIFRGEELIFYAVKSIKKRTASETLRKLRKVMGKLIAEYRVECAAIEKVVFIQQQSSFVKRVEEELEEFVRKRQDIELFEYHPKLIRQIVCGLERPTKRNTALILSQKYGELAHYFNVPKLWQKRYFALLFDAIAVGLACAEDIKSEQEKFKKLAINE